MFPVIFPFHLTYVKKCSSTCETYWTPARMRLMLTGVVFRYEAM